MPPLLRRREVVLPTLWGTLLLACLIGGGAWLLARSLGPFLATTEPAAAAPVLVVEGWLGERELDAAAAYARQHGYRRVLTSGGPIELSFSAYPSYAERAAAGLNARLAGVVTVVAVPAPATAQDRTFASAVWVRDWLAQQRQSVPALNVYSVGPHARRTRAVYRLAFGPDTEVGVVAGRPARYDPARWWTTSEAAKDTLMEAISLAWTTCCFWPPPRGSHEERWAVPLRP